MPCKHAKLMMIYAEQAAEMDEPWKLWEYCDDDGRWFKLYGHFVFEDKCEYRQITKTININSHEVPEPMREEPDIGTDYFVVSPYSDDGVEGSTWEVCNVDKRFLRFGLCHLTREAAIAHAKALFSFTEVK